MFSKKLLETRSPYNGRILVLEDIGGRRRVATETAGGQMLSQSGYLVQRIWEEALRGIQNSKLNIQSVLILGLGAGSIVEVIKDRLPVATIDAVEVDPVMPAIGMAYFGLSAGDVTIFLDDARHFVKKPKDEAYDLICVDLFIGEEPPAFTATEDWLKEIRRILSPNGIVFFNRLYYGRHREEVSAYLDKCEKVFSIEDTRILPSRLAGTNFVIKGTCRGASPAARSKRSPRKK